jgi:hypothetical protein
MELANGNPKNKFCLLGNPPRSRPDTYIYLYLTSEYIVIREDEIYLHVREECLKVTLKLTLWKEDLRMCSLLG